MAVVPNFVPSEWDTQNMRAYCFPGQQLTHQMIRRNINIPYFDNPPRYTPVVLTIYARGRCSIEGWNETDNHRVVAAAELTAPNLPNACFANQDAARRLFIRGGLTGIVNQGYSSQYSDGFRGLRPQSNVAAVDAILRRIPNAAPASLDTFLRELLNIGAEDPIQEAALDANLAQAVALMLDLLAHHCTPRARALGCNLYTLMFVGLAKRGSVTEAKLNAINHAVTQETNFTCDVSKTEIDICGSIMTNFVDQTNAEAIMEGLRAEISNYSLRLTLTVMQTVKSGMTSYWAIDEALRLFTTFRWSEASKYIPDDFIRYRAARRAVAGNLYYGFRKDLGDAKHTLYRNLSWLAIKLLIKFKGGEYGSLKAYRGLPAHPDYETELQALIDEYVPPVAEQPWANIDEFLQEVRAVGGGQA